MGAARARRRAKLHRGAAAGGGGQLQAAAAACAAAGAATCSARALAGSDATARAPRCLAQLPSRARATHLGRLSRPTGFSPSFWRKAISQIPEPDNCVRRRVGIETDGFRQWEISRGA
jgi:hypothetical protein